jgi:hypothetical protein
MYGSGVQLQLSPLIYITTTVFFNFHPQKVVERDTLELASFIKEMVLSAIIITDLLLQMYS